MSALSMTTGYLLDTCVLSETSRVKPNPKVLQFIKSAPNLVIPAAAIVEFQLGIMQLCSRDPVKAVRLTTWYQGVIAAGMPILETGKEVAEVWGNLAADPRLRNLVVSHPGAKRIRFGQDLHIAAAALVSQMPIATFNVKDFLLIDSCYPLPGIYNPQDDKWYAQPAMPEQVNFSL
ncbi:PIN domain-containing protein [Sinorhizobium fredii]|uniref:PIN domain-containing protein n=2 Tax=Rhizobium fredii TaxID=380 RepID=UPI0031380184